MIKPLITAAGFTLITIGAIGTIMPLMPGFPFLLAGAALLGKDHPIVRPFISRLERRRKGRNSRKSD